METLSHEFRKSLLTHHTLERKHLAHILFHRIQSMRLKLGIVDIFDEIHLFVQSWVVLFKIFLGNLSFSPWGTLPLILHVTTRNVSRHYQKSLELEDSAPVKNNLSGGWFSYKVLHWLTDDQNRVGIWIILSFSGILISLSICFQPHLVRELARARGTWCRSAHKSS